MYSKKLKGLMAVVLASVCLAGCSSSVNMPDSIKVESIEGETNSVTVSAVAARKAVPDKANVTLSIQTTRADAVESQSANTETTNKVIEVLKGLGIPEGNIQTSSYSMYEDYDYGDNGRTLLGYMVSNDLDVSGVDIDKLGTVITKSVGAGATRVNQVSYECSTYDEIYAEALKEAIAQATEKATIMAEADGQKLGKAISINEGYQDTSARYIESYSMMPMKAESVNSLTDGAADVSMMPGELDIEAKVSISFEMNE